MALYMRTSALTTLRQILRSNKTAFHMDFPFMRTLLSDAYRGTSAWSSRKILAVNMDELKIKLDADFFDLKKPVSSVDLHKFIDNVSDEHELHSAEQYLYCHRHSPMANHLRASTVHSYVRTCIDLQISGRTLKLLQDKTNYGLFPENFTFNLLLDDFLQRGDIKSAATVAMEMMRLEILTDEERLSQLLSLYVCHQHLMSQESTQEETHDLGMTFADATRGYTNLLSSSYHVLGLIMAGRLKEAVTFLQAALDRGNGPCIVQEVIERLHGILENQTETNQEIKNKLQDCVTRLKEDGRLSQESLDNLVTSETLTQIKELEQNHTHIARYPSLLEEWHQEHIEAVRSQIRAAQEHEKVLKENKLEKLMEAVGGLNYWLEKEKRRKVESDAEGEEIKEIDETEMEKQIT